MWSGADWSGVELDNGVFCPHQDFFTYIKVVSSEMAEKTRVPKENHQPFGKAN